MNSCLYSFDARDAVPRAGPDFEPWEPGGSPGKHRGSLRRFRRNHDGAVRPRAPNRTRHRPGAAQAPLSPLPKRALLLVSNRFRGLGPATVEHVQKSGCTLLTLGFDNEAALWITLGGDQVSKNQLIKDSGGRRFSAETPDMSGVCRQIAYALKNYYVLGYMTDTGTEVKNPQKIEVSVPGKNYTLHYRRTFVPQ